MKINCSKYLFYLKLKRIVLENGGKCSKEKMRFSPHRIIVLLPGAALRSDQQPDILNNLNFKKMGIQKGALRLKGSHGDFTFAETKDGFLWKKKVRELDPNRFQTIPGFIKIKENMDEFARTGKAVKFLRRVLTSELDFAKDSRLTTRLQTLMMKVTKSDDSHKKGQKMPGAGDVTFFEKFELNADAELRRSLAVDIDTSFDRITGKVLVNIPAFISENVMKYASNVNAYKIVATAVEVDFGAELFTKTVKSSAIIPIGSTMSPALVLKPDVSPASVLPVFVVVGIQFSEETTNFSYPEKNGEFQALCIVKADRP